VKNYSLIQPKLGAAAARIYNQDPAAGEDSTMKSDHRLVKCLPQVAADFHDLHEKKVAVHDRSTMNVLGQHYHRPAKRLKLLREAAAEDDSSSSVQGRVETCQRNVAVDADVT
jgi:hypothetical protein